MSNETSSSGETVLVDEAMYRDTVATQFERDDARDRRQEVRNIGEPRVENLEGEVHVEEEFEEEIEEQFEVGNYNYGGRGYRPPRGRGPRGRRGGRLPRFGKYRYSDYGYGGPEER
ncbi:hypothetical protein GH714_009055 [Hevea brasiliensis]|uniref:Uncharacterized protein n=1 Tax=Hevea brasiliensis TaxID=3981 RepID=A0A6A6MDT2_HEVBR|nr:hypothetical protein GH714_009055 [Hevea brasiliensis]